MDIMARIRRTWYMTERRSSIQLGTTVGDDRHGIDWCHLYPEQNILTEPRPSYLARGEDTWLRHVLRSNRVRPIDMPRGRP